MDDAQLAEAAHLAHAQSESEFIQSLAAPLQLHYLATTTDLSGAPAQRYLADLLARYRADPLLLATLKFPLCLFFLDLLVASQRFRDSLKNPAFVAYLEQCKSQDAFLGEFAPR